MLTYAKAIAAFVVVFVALLVGDEAAEGIDVGLLESTIVALLAAAGVWRVPNARRPFGENR